MALQWTLVLLMLNLSSDMNIFCSCNSVRCDVNPTSPQIGRLLVTQWTSWKSIQQQKTQFADGPFHPWNSSRLRTAFSSRKTVQQPSRLKKRNTNMLSSIIPDRKRAVSERNPVHRQTKYWLSNINVRDRSTDMVTEKTANYSRSPSKKREIAFNRGKREESVKHPRENVSPPLRQQQINMKRRRSRTELKQSPQNNLNRARSSKSTTKTISSGWKPAATTRESSRDLPISFAESKETVDGSFAYSLGAAGEKETAPPHNRGHDLQIRSAQTREENGNSSMHPVGVEGESGATVRSSHLTYFLPLVKTESASRTDQKTEERRFHISGNKSTSFVVEREAADRPKRSLGKFKSLLGQVLEQMSLDRSMRCLALFIAGHKYFGFDPRKGNEITWRYRDKGFFTAFPRPRLKQLHPDVVEACSKGAVECVNKLATIAMMSVILKDQNITCRSLSPIPSDASAYYPFENALDLFRFRTTASYYLCWLTLKRTEIFRKVDTNDSRPCLEYLRHLYEPLDNQKRVLDHRVNGIPFQCALISFCPDPCYGRKTNGMVPSKEFQELHDPGNPCRALKDQTCSWLYDNHNSNFDDLQKNRFNISCTCYKEREGFAWDSKYELCVDVDECLEKRPWCGDNKLCVNVEGSYKCVCKAGYLLQQDGSCVQHVVIPQPAINHTLLRARYLQQLIKREGTVDFLEKQFENVLGLNVGCHPVPGIMWHLASALITIVLRHLATLP